MSSLRRGRRPFAEDATTSGGFGGLEHLPRLEALRAFFADADRPGSQSRLVDAVRFRMSSAHAIYPGPVAAWLRQGVRKARDLNCGGLDRTRLRDAIPTIRALTRVKEPSKFLPSLTEICAAAGAAVVLVRTPQGCPASGATHYDSDRAIIQLSFRYRSDDHLWFTVFHEIGHILLHGYSGVFIEGQDLDDSSEESEANAFSAHILIPEEAERELSNLKPDYRVIMRASLGG